MRLGDGVLAAKLDGSGKVKWVLGELEILKRVDWGQSRKDCVRSARCKVGRQGKKKGGGEPSTKLGFHKADVEPE
jgi:hypothetical protein